jgi:hypothetical protein
LPIGPSRRTPGGFFLCLFRINIVLLFVILFFVCMCGF